MKRHLLLTTLIATMTMNLGEEPKNLSHALENVSAASDTLSEKQRFYHMMELKGWEFYFNYPKDEELRLGNPDFEYKIMPRSWSNPYNPEIPGIELPDVESIWRRPKYTRQPESKYV